MTATKSILDERGELIDEIAQRQSKVLRLFQAGPSYTYSQRELGNHMNLFKQVADAVTRQQVGHDYYIDGDNRDIIVQLIGYFNGWTQLLEGSGIDLSKNLLVLGVPGVGKTLLMQIAEKYCELIGLNRTGFKNISMSELLNYQKMNSHINRYTYNVNDYGQQKPFGVCIHDLGIETETQKSYGTSLSSVVDEFLFSRYDIYQQSGVNYHITTNLTIQQFEKRFDQRLIDRMKSFNIIRLRGVSKR